VGGIGGELLGGPLGGIVGGALGSGFGGAIGTWANGGSFAQGLINGLQDANNALVGGVLTGGLLGGLGDEAGAIGGEAGDLAGDLGGLGGEAGGIGGAGGAGGAGGGGAGGASSCPIEPPRITNWTNPMRGPLGESHIPPAEGEPPTVWRWRGKGEPPRGGNWYDSSTGNSLHNHLDDTEMHGPHWDWHPPKKYRTAGQPQKYRLYPNGDIEEEYWIYRSWWH